MFGNGTHLMDPADVERTDKEAARRLRKGGGLCCIRISPTALKPALEVSHA